ncbi:MAG: anthranilate synthase component I [Phycisphaerales bacterium]
MNLSLSREAFVRTADAASAEGADAICVIPIAMRLLSDQLTPVLAYRRLVVADERPAPSFLFESVEGGERQGRHSILGASPAVEIRARMQDVDIIDRRGGGAMVEASVSANPMDELKRWSRRFRLITPDARDATFDLPECLIGGWVGYASYDTVRYAEPDKLPFETAPTDDRDLPDLHFGFYDEVVVFDHVGSLIYIVRLVEVGTEEAGAAWDHASAALASTAERLQRHSRPLPIGAYDPPAGVDIPESNITRESHASMVERAQEYIKAGDIFQVVIGQRFERASRTDPFDVYRALRAVNPSPYMVYLQASGCILIASSPEILCRVRNVERSDGSAAQVVTNRPLAGTRRRGATPDEDLALERELLADEKERAEHVMLVDLGRNDVGRVAKPGTVSLDALMEIERYSHVMHISSTVTGVLRDGLDCWDALASTLPVGTISGAPKVRAMQIIDELEPVRRGPYGGGIGYVSLNGEMDIALALRTIVTPIPEDVASGADPSQATWTYHLQAAGGIVYDSVAEAEYMETVNKAAAMLRAVEVAERAFGDAPSS